MHHSVNKYKNTTEYYFKQAIMIARLINDSQEKFTIMGYSYAQQFMLNKGLKIFGERGQKAALN